MAELRLRIPDEIFGIFYHFLNVLIGSVGGCVVYIHSFDLHFQAGLVPGIEPDDPLSNIVNFVMFIYRLFGS